MKPLFILAIGSSVIQLLAVIPYIYDIMHGRTRPARTSYLLWSILGIISFAGQVAAGGGLSVLFTGIQTLVGLIILGLGFKSGYGGWSRLDVLCLIGALFGLIGWGFTHQPLTALFIVVFIDSLALIPTLRKSYFFPESETTITWLMGVVAAILAAGAVGQWNLALLIYPIYIALANLAVLVLLMRKGFTRPSIANT